MSDRGALVLIGVTLLNILSRRVLVRGVRTIAPQQLTSHRFVHAEPSVAHFCS